MSKAYNPYQIQERGRISALQLSFLVVTFVLSTADVFLPAFVAQEAGQDSWISVIFATVYAIIMANIILTLGLRHPDKTIIQYSCDILGKPLGKLIGVFCILFFLNKSWILPRQLGEIFVVSFNPNSPVLVYSLLVVLVAAYAVFSGLEVIARINDILLPIGLLVLISVALLNIPKMDMRNFLPILYDGFLPPVKGALMVQTWLMEVVIILQMIPFVKEKIKIRKNINIALLVLGVSLLSGVLIIAIFGPFTKNLLFPALQYVRFASFGPYIQNFDISIMAVWISGIFVKITISYYCAVLGISQFFGFKSYKQMIIPVGVLVVCLSIVSFKTLPELVYFIKYIGHFFTFIFSFIIPVTLLLVSLIKGKAAHTGTHAVKE